MVKMKKFAKMIVKCKKTYQNEMSTFEFIEKG